MLMALRNRFSLGFTLSLGLLLAASACTHREPEPPAPTDSASQVAAATAEGCDDKSFCTREYMPTKCVLGTRSFDASNRCEAMKLARRYACEQKLNFNQAEVKCEQESAAPAEEGL